MYNVRLSKTVLKHYSQISNKTLLRAIDSCLLRLEENPYFGPGIKRLKGDYRGYYRIMTDGYRIVYRVDRDENVIEVLSVATYASN